VSRARAAGWALAACAALACVLPVAARADAVTGAQLRSLAERAADDPAALARLRRVDRVDGRRVEVAGALRGARGRDLQARLRLLAASPAPARAAGDPRGDAREILSQRRFTGTRVPGPFRSLLDWLGDRLRSLGNALDDLLPGGRSIVWIALGAVVAALAAIVARRTLTGRVRAATRAAAAAAPPRDDARELERRADAAEAAGDLEAALRLRFRAGLLRLGARGAIEFRPSISTYEVRRALRSADFDALAADFDDVVYGGRPAAPGDVENARRRWPEVVEGAAR
jgi:Domain of unknown function (DUF4129)